MTRWREITAVYVNSLVSKEPIGYEVQEGKIKKLYYRSQVITMLKAGTPINGVKLFVRKNPGSPDIVTIKSTIKGKSLSDKSISKNINHLQRRTWNNEIDYTNAVQLKFTVKL